MKEEKKKRGGKRPNAGRPSRWNEKTVTVSARVPKSRKAEIEQMIKEALKPAE